MKKTDILKILEKQNLNKEDFIIISGAAMVLRNLKEETSDIDIAVSNKYYEELLKTKNCTLERIVDGVHIWFIDNVINFSTNFNDSKSNTLYGYNVQTIESIIDLKEKLGREKDLKDIERIKNIWGKISINLLNDLVNIFKDCSFLIEKKDIKNIENLKEKIKNAKQIEIILTEDMVMAFDREYTNGFYRPDWDDTINDFEKTVKDYNCQWHMPDPFTILIEDSTWINPWA